MSEKIETYPHHQRMADATCAFVNSTMFQMHRGAFHIESGIVAVFGNDAIKEDVRSQRERELVVRAITEFYDGTIIAKAQDEYSWVLLVTGVEEHLLRGKVWDAWQTACAEAKSDSKAAA